MLDITNVSFINSTVKSEGGAISLNGVKATILNSNFENNTAYNGGAITYKCNYTLNNCNLTVNNSNFTNNIAIQDGGAISWFSKEPFLNNIIYTNNNAFYGSDLGTIRYIHIYLFINIINIKI